MKVEKRGRKSENEGTKRNRSVEFGEEKKKKRGQTSVGRRLLCKYLWRKKGESSKIEKPEERGTERRENYRIDIKL